MTLAEALKNQSQPAKPTGKTTLAEALKSTPKPKLEPSKSSLRAPALFREADKKNLAENASLRPSSMPGVGLSFVPDTTLAQQNDKDIKTNVALTKASEKAGNLPTVQRILAAADSGAESAIGGGLNALQTAVQFAGDKLGKVFGTEEALKDPKNQETLMMLAKGGALGNGGTVNTPAVLTPDKLMKSAQTKSAAALEDTSGVGKFALEGVSAATNMATGAATSLITGIPFVAQMGIQGGGNAAYDAKQQGKTIDQQFNYGLQTGIATGLIESIGGIGASQVTKAAANKVASSLLAKLPTTIANWMNTTGAKIGGKIISSAISEAGEEAAQYNVDLVLQKLTLDNDVPFDIKQMAYQALQGGVLGGIFGGGTSVANAIANPQSATPKPITPTKQPQNTVLNNNLNTMDSAVTSPQAPQSILSTQGIQTPTAQSNVVQGNVDGQNGKQALPEGMGAASNPYKTVTKVSDFFTNTIKNTDTLDDVAKGKVEARDYTFDSEGEKQTVAIANQRLEQDFQGEVAALSKPDAYRGAEDVDTAMGILSSFGKASTQIDNPVSDAIFANWAKQMYRNVHTWATGLQALDKYTRTPENGVVKALSAVENIADDKTTVKENGKIVRDANGKPRKNELGKKIEAEGKQVSDAVRDEGRRAVDDVTKALEKAADSLLKKVDNTTKTPKTPEVNAIDDMVNELFRSAKESPIPEKVATAKRNPIEFLTQAIQNKAQYVEVWKDAKWKLYKKYEDNPEVLEMLKAYFEKGIIPIYSNATLTKSIKQTLDDLDLKLKDIKELSWQDRQNAIAKIRDYLIKETGTEGADARALSRDITSKITAMIINSKPLLTKKAKEDIKLATQDAMRNHGLSNQIGDSNSIGPVQNWATETGQMLSDALAKKLTPTDAKPQALSNDFLNDIMKFSENLAPKKVQGDTAKRTEADRVKDFYNNPEKFIEMWRSMQEGIRAQFPSNSVERLFMFDKLLNTDVKQAALDYAVTGKLESRINSALKDINVKLSEIITQRASVKEQTVKTISDMLIDKYGISSADAEVVSQKITDKFYELVAERSKKRLDNMFKVNEKTDKKKQSWLNTLDELVNLGAFDTDSYTDAIKEKYGLPTLSTQDIKTIYDYMLKSEQAKTEYDKNMWLSRATQVVTDKLPSNLWDKVRAVRRISMLMNPKTLISRNAGGNLIFAGVENLKDAPGAFIDLLTSKSTGMRSTPFAPISNLKAQGKGFAKGVVELGKDIKNNVNTSPTSHEMNNPSMKNLQPTTVLKSKVGSTIEKAMNRFLQAGDRPFYEAAYAQRVNELQKLGYDTTADEHILDATQFALERVFQNNSALSKKASQLRESLGPLGDVLMPFVQTPSNIFNVLLDYTPVGYAKAIKKWGTMKSNQTVFSQKQFVDTLARSVTGTGLLMLGYALAKAGLLMGRLPDDDKKAQMLKLEGKQAYSINFGDKSYTYDWASPIGALLAFGADYYQAGADKKGFLDSVVAGSKAGVDVLFQQSYLDGLSQLFRYNSISTGLEQTLANLPASFVPTGFSQLAKILDTTQRETYSDSALQKVINKMLVKIPFASTSLQPKVSTSGGDLQNFNGRPTGSNIFESALSPGYIGQDTRTKVDAEMSKLYSATGNEDVLPPVPPAKSFDANTKPYTLTSAEYTKFQQTRNSYIYKEMNKLINSSDYKNASTAKQTDMVKEIVSDARELAKQTIVEGRGEMYLDAYGMEDVQTYADAGVTTKQAYDLYKEIKALKPEGDNKSVSTYQEVSTIMSQKYNNKQTISLVATLYTDKDKDGNIKKESLLPYLNNTNQLLLLYKGSKDAKNPNGDYDLINMTIPEKFSDDSIVYELTNSERKVYKDTYTQYFNSHSTTLMTAEQIKTLSNKAEKAAKKAITKGRD